MLFSHPQTCSHALLHQPRPLLTTSICHKVSTIKDLQPKPASRSDVKFEDNFKRGLRVRWNGTLAGFNWGERTFYDFTEQPAPLFTHFPFTSHNLCLLLQSFKACWVKKLLYQHVCNCVHSYCDVKVENRGCQDLKQGNLSKQF